MSLGIVNSSVQSETIRQSIREAPLVAIRELMTDQRILKACTACGYTFRQRLYGQGGPGCFNLGDSNSGHPSSFDRQGVPCVARTPSRESGHELRRLNSSPPTIFRTCLIRPIVLARTALWLLGFPFLSAGRLPWCAGH
ncbi:MAG: hypothetical protein IIA33_10825 [Planctomycetes bacterium]|nr:hypothetical protein [Planctomycetota bacterium]